MIMNQPLDSYLKAQCAQASPAISSRHESNLNSISTAPSAMSCAMSHGPCAMNHQSLMIDELIHSLSIVHRELNPPATLVGATKLRSIICNPVSNAPCILCTLRSISRLPFSVSGPLESVSGILELLLPGPGDPPIYHQPGGFPGSGVSPEPH